MTHAALNPRTREIFSRVGTATLATQLFKRGLRNTAMQGVRRLGRAIGPNLVGPAFTVRNIPAREDIDHLGVFEDVAHPQRLSIERLSAGQVMVVDCRGLPAVASGGSILLARLRVRGAAGFVSDGGVRDSDVVSGLSLPVFCAGPAAPLNLVAHHAVDFDLPIACGGVAVYPGDVIVGDGDGVVVVPRALADEVAQDAARQEHFEGYALARVKAGSPLAGLYPPSEATRRDYEAQAAGGDGLPT